MDTQASISSWPVDGTPLQLYSDDALLNGSVKTIKQNKRQQLTITIPCNGGVVVTEVQ